MNYDAYTKEELAGMLVSIVGDADACKKMGEIPGLYAGNITWASIDRARGAVQKMKQGKRWIATYFDWQKRKCEYSYWAQDAEDALKVFASTFGREHNPVIKSFDQ